VEMYALFTFSGGYLLPVEGQNTIFFKCFFPLHFKIYVEKFCFGLKKNKKKEKIFFNMERKMKKIPEVQ